VDWVRVRDPAGRVLALPNQTLGLLERVGLTRDQVNTAVWAVDREGRRFGGAAAVNCTWQELGGRWRLLARLCSLPPLFACETWFYAWFARNRGHFARWGTTPACMRPGVPCTPYGE
jgi:predicted DCC family thiol-disulfide oxidoreductase YuxK